MADTKMTNVPIINNDNLNDSLSDSERLFFEKERTKSSILKVLAQHYKAKLDDPSGGTKNYDSTVIENKDTVELDKSTSKLKSIGLFMKRKSYLKDLLKNEGIEYFKQMRKENLSNDACKFCENMYEKYDIVPIADAEILDYFSRIIGTVYNGSTIGKFSIVRDWSSIEKWQGRIKHEGIHNKQGPIWKWKSAGIDLLKRRSELSGLVPWAMDYATDNQISDWETYINQYKEDPIKDVKKYGFKRFKVKENRFDAIEKHMQSDIDDLKNEIKDLENKISDVKDGTVSLDKNDGFTQEEWLLNLNYLLDLKRDYLKSMERLQDEHHNTDDWHQFITFGEQDGYIYQDTPEKRQTNFQSEESFRKHVVIDSFITHYGDKKDNYKEGVEMYSKHKDELQPIIENYLKTKDKKSLKKHLKDLYSNID